MYSGMSNYAWNTIWDIRIANIGTFGEESKNNDFRKVKFELTGCRLSMKTHDLHLKPQIVGDTKGKCNEKDLFSPPTKIQSGILPWFGEKIRRNTEDLGGGPPQKKKSYPNSISNYKCGGGYSKTFSQNLGFGGGYS